MGVDSFDAMFTRHPNDALNLFKKMDTKMVFNGTLANYPPVPELAAAEDKMSLGLFGRLNAGAWIGETKFCKYFFDICDRSRDEVAQIAEKYNPFLKDMILKSEQALVKHGFNKIAEIDIDSNCQIFQILNFIDLYPPELKETLGVGFDDIISI